jgi:hypothetical protein
MKRVVQYVIVNSETGDRFGTFLDRTTAEEWLEIANKGYCKSIWWWGKQFEIVEQYRKLDTLFDPNFWYY